MHKEQAQAFNQDISEQIQVLRDKLVSKMRVRVVERIEGGRRQTVESFDTDYINFDDSSLLYKDLRAKYSDVKQFFVVLEPIEERKRSVQVVLPRRTDDERDPPSSMKTPDGVDPFAEA